MKCYSADIALVILALKNFGAEVWVEFQGQYDSGRDRVYSHHGDGAGGRCESNWS